MWTIRPYPSSMYVYSRLLPQTIGNGEAEHRLSCAATSRKIPRLQRDYHYKRKILRQGNTVRNCCKRTSPLSKKVSKYLCTTGKPSIRLLMLSLFFNPSKFTNILPVCSCFTIGSLQLAPDVIHNFLRKFSALFMQWYIQPTYPNFRNDSKTSKTFQMQFTYFRISSL